MVLNIYKTRKKLKLPVKYEDKKYN